MSDAPVPLEPEVFGPESQCFGCAPHHPIGMHLRPMREGDAVTVRFVPPETYQGPLGLMHGGLVTTLADELAAWAVVGLRERFGFTGAIDARLLKPVRVGVEVQGRAHITRDHGRLLKVAVSLAQEGAEVFKGEFTFVVLDAAGASRIMGGAELPEHWRRFTR